MEKDKTPDEPRLIDVPFENDDPDRALKAWRKSLPVEYDPEMPDARWTPHHSKSYFGEDIQPKTAPKQPQTNTSPLEGKVLDHILPVISQEERARRTKWANIALPRSSGWEGTIGEMISILEDLGQARYEHVDYTTMDSKQLIVYFDAVTKEIGADSFRYCPDVAWSIIAQNIGARTKGT